MGIENSLPKTLEEAAKAFAERLIRWEVCECDGQSDAETCQVCTAALFANHVAPLYQEIERLTDELKRRHLVTGKSTHGKCCTCQKCKEDYDSCRCSLDEVAEENEQLLERARKAEAERDHALLMERLVLEGQFAHPAKQAIEIHNLRAELERKDAALRGLLEAVESELDADAQADRDTDVRLRTEHEARLYGAVEKAEAALAPAPAAPTYRQICDKRGCRSDVVPDTEHCPLHAPPVEAAPPEPGEKK